MEGFLKSTVFKLLLVQVFAFGFNFLTNLAPTQSEKLCAGFWYDLFSINNDFTDSYYCLGF